MGRRHRLIEAVQIDKFTQINSFLKNSKPNVQEYTIYVKEFPDKKKGTQELSKLSKLTILNKRKETIRNLRKPLMLKQHS